MHDPLAVQLSYRKDDLSRVKPDNVLLEPLLRLKNFVQLATPDEGHHEVESSL